MDLCTECGGEGELECEECDGTGFEADEVTYCPECNAAGMLECAECNGTGQRGAQ